MAGYVNQIASDVNCIERRIDTAKSLCTEQRKSQKPCPNDTVQEK